MSDVAALAPRPIPPEPAHAVPVCCPLEPLTTAADLEVRLPFLVISPSAKRNYVDHSLNDTTSILRFIEYNWGLGTIGDPQSFDVLASGTILGMFDFDRDRDDAQLILDPTTSQVIRGSSH